MKLSDEIMTVHKDGRWRTVNEILPLLSHYVAPSNVSRLCKQLFEQGYLVRRERPQPLSISHRLEYEYCSTSAVVLGPIF